MNDDDKDQISLKWGTLKRWKLNSAPARELMAQYVASKPSASGMTRGDTQEQKAIICQLIDACTADEIYLDWDDVYVSKEDAKKYVLEYRN